MKKGKVTYMYCMALRFFKATLSNGFQSPLHISIFKCLYSVCLRKGEISVDHTSAWKPFNADLWTTIIIILTTIIIEPQRSIQMKLTSTIQLQRTLILKKSWNKWQLEMAESLYLLDTTFNLSFTIESIWYFLIQ